MRILMGYHSMGKQDPVFIYGRDKVAPVLRQIESIVQMMSERIWIPYVTRSGYSRAMRSSLRRSWKNSPFRPWGATAAQRTALMRTMWITSSAKKRSRTPWVTGVVIWIVMLFHQIQNCTWSIQFRESSMCLLMSLEIFVVIREAWTSAKNFCIQLANSALTMFQKHVLRF